MRSVTLKNKIQPNRENVIFLRLCESEEMLLTALLMLMRLLKGGIAIRKAMHILTVETKHSLLKQKLCRVSDNIEKGTSLSESILGSKLNYPQYVLYLIQVGEETGQLVSCLENAVNHLKRRSKLKKKIKEAFLYPAFVLLLGVAAIAVMFQFVLPNMMTIYDAFDQELPKLTRHIIWIQENFKYVSGIACLFVALITLGWRCRIFQVKHFQHLLPAGNLFNLYRLGLFTEQLALYLKSGIPILRAIKNLESISMPEMVHVREKLSSGESLSRALLGMPWLDASSLALIATGEEAGSLDQTLEEISGTSNEEFSFKITQAMKLLEPVCLLVVGGIICLIVVAMFLPIIEMNDFF